MHPKVLSAEALTFERLRTVKLLQESHAFSNMFVEV